MNRKEDFDGGVEMVITAADNGFASFSRPALILRGILGALIGFALLMQPYFAMLFITVAIGVFMIIDGGLLIGYVAAGGKRGRAIGLTYGILILLLGILTIWNPLFMNLAWIIMIGVWQLISGVNMVTGEYKGRHAGMIRFSGVISILLGLIFIVWPFTGMAVYIRVGGAFLLVASILMIFSGIFKSSDARV